MAINYESVEERVWDISTGVIKLDLKNKEQVKLHGYDLKTLRDKFLSQDEKKLLSSIEEKIYHIMEIEIRNIKYYYDVRKLMSLTNEFHNLLKEKIKIIELAYTNLEHDKNFDPVIKKYMLANKVY